MLFGYAVGPQSWKKYLHPSNIQLWSAERENGTFRILNQEPQPKKRYAFLGVRACDLAAIGLQDRVLLEDRHQDPIYAGRRDAVFIVAVQCMQAVSTCFCASMGTGPRARGGLRSGVDRSGWQWRASVSGAGWQRGRPRSTCRT